MSGHKTEARDATERNHNHLLARHESLSMMYTRSSRATSIAAAVLYFSSLIISIDAHGHMTSPRSRNWFAHEDGVTSGIDNAQTGIPPKENCQHCLNSNEGVCGKVANGGRSYDPFLDSTGQEMPWISQETYNEGETILIKSYLDTHHNGHMTLRACADGPDSTQECFDTVGNELTFVSDQLYDMPPDPDYPDRGYYAGGQGGGLKDFAFVYRLPSGISGDRVMLQWKYITANSCSPPGYEKYFNGNNLPGSYWTSGLSACQPPYPNDGSGWPERFFNCAEVSILSAGPTSPSTMRPVAAPFLAPISPVAPTAPTPQPPTPSGDACCTRDFKNCNLQLEGWCSESEANCVNSCFKFWLPNGAITGCTARYESCTNDSECCSPGVCDGGMCELSKTPVARPPNTPSPPSPSAPTPTSTGNFCCSQDFKVCVTWCGSSQYECESCDQDVFWIQQPGSNCKARWGECTGSPDSCCTGLTCVGDGGYSQCKYVASPPTNPPAPTVSPTATPTNPPVPTVSPMADPPSTTSPTMTPTTRAPTTTPKPKPLFSCSDGAGKSTWDSLLAMEKITRQVSNLPHVLAVVSSGGAAGDGSYVVSESQAYGVLSAGLTLISMEEGNENYDKAKLKFQGYFNGWRQMCRSSAPPPCQNPTYCDNGETPCLPGWKHLADFSDVIGTGSAPDGDVDAIVGMIIALKAVQSDSVKPTWYDEVSEWADQSCTQFLQDNTVLSPLKSHRLLRLGSCWGGWGEDGEGNNPSYHAPGHYRMMRDFQASVQNRSYTLPSYVKSDSWNSLIDTSYKFLKTTQCLDTGLVPNWALVEEIDSKTLAKKAGSFSGSGTPQYEFGAEASRTMWRIAFDAAAYPDESATQSGSFLDPLYVKLVENFNPSPMNGWEYFGENSLQACSPNIVSNVFSAWQWNYFISAPVFSTLVGGISAESFIDYNFDQQIMVDAACSRVSDTADQGYYPLSWQVIAQMTLNGEVAKAGTLHESTPTQSPTATPNPPPTTSPTVSKSLSPTTVTCTLPGSNCFQSKKEAGCDDNVCQQQVCNAKRSCCKQKWNKVCKNKAKKNCKPCACSEEKKGEFFLKLKKPSNKATFKSCKWLEMKSEKVIKKTCKKFTSFDGVKAARFVCPITCLLCTNQSIFSK